MKARLADAEVALRRWRSSDAEELRRVVSEALPSLTRWMAWTADGYSVEAATEFLAATEDEWVTGTAFNYVIEVSGALTGAINAMARIGPGGLELGYWLHPAWEDRGFATRATALLVAEAFRVGADRVEIVTDVANVRSAAIPRRLGFVEVERRPAQAPVTSAKTGTEIVWRRIPDRDRSGKVRGSS